MEAIKKEADVLQSMALEPSCCESVLPLTTWVSTEAAPFGKGYHTLSPWVLPASQDHPNIVKFHGVYYERRHQTLPLRVTGSTTVG